MRIFILFICYLVCLWPGIAKADRMASENNSFNLRASSSYGTPTLALPRLSAGNALQALYLSFGSADLMTSLGIALHTVPHIYEVNPILGAHPAILTYSLALPFAFGVTSGIAAALNPRDRAIVLFFGSVGEVYSFIGNLSSGLSPVLYALPSVLIGVGVGILAGIALYYIAHSVLEHYHYYDHQPVPFVSRAWPLKGEKG